VLIEPSGPLRELLLTWKSRAAAQWPSAGYVDHPPHSTIWAGDLADPDRSEDAFREAASGVQELCIDVRSPYVFYNDALTGGGHTCAFAADLTDDLARLQYAISNALRVHRVPVSVGQLPVSLQREPFLRSWREYAFPFVGSHWIPHFTVASVPVRQDDPFIAAFLASPAPGQVAVRELSWWRITGERHERLASVRLAPRIPELTGS
jgi:hypothetical protein